MIDSVNRHDRDSDCPGDFERVARHPAASAAERRDAPPRKRRAPLVGKVTPSEAEGGYSCYAGILILLIPRLLNYIVAIYLILIGLIGIFGV